MPAYSRWLILTSRQWILSLWERETVLVCFSPSRWIAVKFMPQFPRLRCLVRAMRARFLSSLRRNSLEELDIRETLNLTTVKVRKSFSLVTQSLSYSILITHWEIFKRSLHKDRLLVNRMVIRSTQSCIFFFKFIICNSLTKIARSYIYIWSFLYEVQLVIHEWTFNPYLAVYIYIVYRALCRNFSIIFSRVKAWRFTRSSQGWSRIPRIGTRPVKVFTVFEECSYSSYITVCWLERWGSTAHYLLPLARKLLSKVTRRLVIFYLLSSFYETLTTPLCAESRNLFPWNEMPFIHRSTITNIVRAWLPAVWSYRVVEHGNTTTFE